VVAQRKAAVGSKATGRLEWLGVREGSVVKTGELIARLERAMWPPSCSRPTPMGWPGPTSGRRGRSCATPSWRWAGRGTCNFIAQAQVDQAEARGSGTGGRRSAQAAERAAEAGRLAASVAVGQTEIRAPFDGVVLVKNANVGDLITNLSAAADSKGAVVSMADMSTLEVEADVSESSLARIKPGQPCEIQLDAFPELRFRARCRGWCPPWIGPRPA
jgi:multidrug resistance efflux pump